MKVRIYGKAPYHAAVVHGGPGAIGSMAPLARELSQYLSIVEPLQTKYCIDELVEELHDQITFYFRHPIPLIGHSWGAWLCAIYAARFPQTVSKVLLSGCPPLEDEYVPMIEEKRKSHFSRSEATLYDALKTQIGYGRKYFQEELLSQFGKLCAQADDYAPLPPDVNLEKMMKTDARMYTEVFAEAVSMRQSGQLVGCFRQLACPVVIIHGIYDTHPVEGVLEPLKKSNVPYRYYAMEQCGHTPWQERFARRQFLETIVRETAPKARNRAELNV